MTDDWLHLKQYGYAPGNYMNRCHTCEKVVEFVDKRAITCRPCAEARHAAAKSDTPPAPPAVSGLAAEARGDVRPLVRELETVAFNWGASIAEKRPAFVTIKLSEEVEGYRTRILAALATQPTSASASPIAAVGERELREALADALEFIEHYSHAWNGVSAKHPNDIATRARAALSTGIQGGEDAELLDWIERKVCDVSRLGDSARTLRISWNNGADHEFVGPGYHANWRDAIRAARARGDATKEGN